VTGSTIVLKLSWDLSLKRLGLKNRETNDGQDSNNWLHLRKILVAVGWRQRFFISSQLQRQSSAANR
jgi:hypothetical protein